MLYKQSKIEVFGGIYLANSVAIVSILGCCNEVCAKDISDVVNLFNNISWRITANNKIVDADESNWITEEKYRESIIKVISQAVADCITDKNEFANKDANDVIIFNVKAKTYSDENWNAVVLWNYLHILKWDYLHNRKRSKDEIFDDVKKRICDNYPTAGVVDLEGTVDRAIGDIYEYDKALFLSEEMKIYNNAYKRIKGKINAKGKEIIPGMKYKEITAQFNRNTSTKQTQKAGNITTTYENIMQDAISDKGEYKILEACRSLDSEWSQPITIKLYNELYCVKEYAYAKLLYDDNTFSKTIFSFTNNIDTKNIDYMGDRRTMDLKKELSSSLDNEIACDTIYKRIEEKLAKLFEGIIDKEDIKKANEKELLYIERFKKDKSRRKK